MRPASVVVLAPLFDNYPQMAFVERNQEIQALPAKTAPETFAVGIRRRMGGHVVKENAGSSHFHQHEDVEDAERGRHHHEEVAGHDHLGVIVDEGEPALLGVWRAHRAATA